MAKEKVIKGKRCRYYFDGYIWISDDGTVVAVKSNTGSWKYLEIKTDGNGEKYVNTGYKIIYVKKAVFTCFCHCDDHNKTQIWYKDGNPANLHYTNLVAREKQTYHTAAPAFKHTNGLTITKNGEVYHRKVKEKIHNSVGDADTGLMRCIRPHVSAPNKMSGRLLMDDLMATAGYVAGEKYALENPVILHKDNNPMNFSSDNLEWVESTDTRYIEYQKKVEEWKHQRNIELNPGKPLPPGW